MNEYVVGIALVTAIPFGLWQRSWYAGSWMYMVMIPVILFVNKFL